MYVSRIIKVACDQKTSDFYDRFWVEEDTSEYGFFGIERVRGSLEHRDGKKKGGGLWLLFELVSYFSQEGGHLTKLGIVVGCFCVFHDGFLSISKI